MEILIGLVVVIFFLVMIGNSKRVERGEITDEEAIQLTPSNITKGVLGGLRETNKFLSVVDAKMEVKLALQSYLHASNKIKRVIELTQEFKLSDYSLFGSVSSNSRRSNKDDRNIFYVDYEQVCHIIAGLPKEDQKRYLSDLEKAKSKFELKLVELKKLLEDEKYLPSFHEANKHFGSKYLLKLLDLE